MPVDQNSVEKHSGAAAEAISVAVNGEGREVPAGSTVADLARILDLPESGVAIAVDDDVVPAARWADVTLRADAQVDVLTAVQGG